MTSFSMVRCTARRGWLFSLAALALVMAGCAPVDDTIGSHLVQPPAGTPPQQPIDADDIAIVGQDVSHAILQLPAIADASVPPLVQFNGVTSIVDKPIDTEPYTDLLRDRLLLLTRLKLRFIEHTLPPYVPPSKHKKAAPPPSSDEGEADYQILAELRGHADDDTLKIQVQFSDIHTSEVLFNGLYRIHRESNDQPPPEPPEPVTQPPPQEPPSAETPPPAPPPSAPSGNVPATL